MQNKTEEKKSSGSTVLADDGFYFGIGAFETIAVEEGIPQLLAWHLERLRDSLAFFGIDQSVEEKEVLAYLNACPQSEEKQHGALKITVTAQNKLFGLRKTLTQKNSIRKDFGLDFPKSDEMRLHRSHTIRRFGIADNIMEKRNAKKAGWMKRFFSIRKGRSARAVRQTSFLFRMINWSHRPSAAGCCRE